MSKKALATVLLISLVFALAPTAGASSPPELPGLDAGLSAAVEQAGEHVLAATTGGSTASCVGAVLAFSFVALAAGAGTGGVGLALLGAYAPLLLPLCA